MLCGGVGCGGWHGKHPRACVLHRCLGLLGRGWGRAIEGELLLQLLLQVRYSRGGGRLFSLSVCSCVRRCSALRI